MNGEEGYTLVELMVTLLVALVLGALLASIYMAVARRVATWQRAVVLENDAHLMVQRLSTDLLAANQLAFEAERYTWILTDAAGRTTHYRYRGGLLDRNGRRLHDASLEVIDFRLVPSQDETQYAPRRQDGPAGVTRSLLRIALHLSVKNRERTLTFEAAVTLRQPRPWRPLPVPAFGDSTRAR